MNAVEIEEAISELVRRMVGDESGNADACHDVPFDAAEFPFAFLEAFGNKPATINRLRSGGKNSTNKSDIDRYDVIAVLQRNNIHIATLADAGGGPDAVAKLLDELTGSAMTAKHKAKFALATDGQTVHAAALASDEPPLVCDFADLDNHFGYFLELAGISTVRQIRENAFDIKATGRLNRLYVELLKNNPDWDGDQRREDLNHFFARLIFCFFAEDTGIFHGNDLFTETVRQMSDPNGSNTDFVLSEIFRAMDVPTKDRKAAQLRSWADQFPYVNGGLFGAVQNASADTNKNTATAAGQFDVPKFTQIARSYLLHIGSLDWTRINPDIFGSMIQAVADDEERGALGMHYTSVPNILKVLNPLFLDDLNGQLKEAGDNKRKLLNLRKRLARIRVFDPACGSGNFLVVAYKEMRKIEAEINILRGEPERPSDIPLTNFRGIEIRHFAAGIARLALVIAEYQCDELYRGQRLALAEFLPLNNENWITHGNALRLDWLKVCPPTGTTGVKLTEDDLFQTPLEQPEIDFENEGGETYICGNPPYVGDKKQDDEQKEDMQQLFGSSSGRWRSFDYVSGWIYKATTYKTASSCRVAFVATNSICQGQQVPLFWPLVFDAGLQIQFAYTSFKWTNLAKHNAGVIVVVIGLSKVTTRTKLLYTISDGRLECIESPHINAYLAPSKNIFVSPRPKPVSDLPEMMLGNFAKDGGHLFCNSGETRELDDTAKQFLRPAFGAKEFIRGIRRHCFWIEASSLNNAEKSPLLKERLRRVAESRSASSKAATAAWSDRPHRFVETRLPKFRSAVIVPRVSSEAREFLTVGLLPANSIITEAFGIYSGSLWAMALLSTRLHLIWIATVCGRMKTDYRYSNTLGWNTFPVPELTGQNKDDLTRCAEDILLAREAHWPATIAELYDPDEMPEDLRAAHDRNDETLERIYIGRRFKNDTERLETLFRMYTEMTAAEKSA